MNPINVPALAQRAHPLVQISDGQAITISTEVARVFEKRHDHVLDSIKSLIAQLPNSGLPNFRETTIEVAITGAANTQGATRKSPAYHLTRDGFTLLAMGFTGKRALAFKLAYIDAFNKMEAALQSQALPVDTQRDLQTLVDQLASANHQAVEQATQASARMARANERMQHANALALQAAHSVAQQVFDIVLDEDASLARDRWILAMGYDVEGKPAAPIVKRIDRDAFVLSAPGFIDALAAGDVGVTLTNQELSRLAQVSLECIARRVNRQPTAINA